MRKRWEADPEGADLAANSKLLYETCLLNSGFLLDEHLQSHSERIIQLLGADLQVGDVSLMLDEIEYPDVKVEDEEDVKPAEDTMEPEVVVNKDDDVKDEL